MSAEVLRAAAQLMRERAEAAEAQGAHLADADCEELAEHIASWHPAVALAVADWLDAAAKYPRQSSQALTVARTYLGDQS